MAHRRCGANSLITVLVALSVTAATPVPAADWPWPWLYGPRGRRFFVNDLNGPLDILDKQKRTFRSYLDFNGRGGRPGLFPKFTFELNFATGLTSFIFDPDYAHNGVLYTLHMEDPATDAPAAPKAGVVAGLDLTGYTTTPAIPTPTVGVSRPRLQVHSFRRFRSAGRTESGGTGVTMVGDTALVLVERARAVAVPYRRQ